MYKLYLIDKTELTKGEKEEKEEHGFAPDVAKRTALDHLEKKDPHYYTKLAQYDLEEEELQQEYKTAFGTSTKGSSKNVQTRPSTETYPYIKIKGGKTKKETRTGPIKAAAKEGPVVPVAAGFGPMEENKES